MSWHHHYHTNNHHTSCCHGCKPCCSCSSPPLPPPPILDQQLLQTLLLLLQSNPHPHPHPPLKPLKPQYSNKDSKETQSLLHSLLRRVANLETSFPPSPPPQTPPPRPTIKHLAATTIQTHFRRFLARRSRTLRDLNRLAAVKSQASALRSSLSDNPNPNEISRIAIDLLTHLDSIKSRDAMIREGKRAVARELVRVTEFVDKVLVRESGESKSGRGRSGTRVRFTENGSGGEVFDEMPERVFEVQEEDGEVNLGNHRLHQFTEGNVGLSAPLPVTMEHIRDAQSS